MANPLVTLAKERWRYWLSPVVLVVCFYLMIKLSLGGDPLFQRVTTGGTQGQVPDVQYQMTGGLWTLICVAILTFGLLFYLMRHWARYFLNRKIITSYLFFAIIPFFATLLIFFAIIRAWFGITNSLAFNKTLDLHMGEMENFVSNLQSGFGDSDLESDLQMQIQNLIEKAMNDELSSFSRRQKSDIAIAIYIQTKKIPGVPRNLIPAYRTGKTTGNEDMYDDLLTQETPAYEAIIPNWMNLDRWSGIVEDRADLYLRHFSSEEYRGTFNIVVLASERLDAEFLEQFQEYQAVRVTMRHNDGTIYQATDDSEEKWYFKVLFKPLATNWDNLAMDWESGFYQAFGQVRFDLPSKLGSSLGGSGDSNFFYSDQKASKLRFILTIILIVILFELMAFVFGGFLVSYITRSLNTLAEGHEQIAAGELSYRLPYIGKDQLGNMGRSFNSMISSIESLMVQVTEKEKYHQELRIARDIQMSLLPNLDDHEWCSNISAHCIPARDVGGDYYEVVQAPGGEIGVFIADVSGKGTSAAFYMAELKGVLIALRHLWNKPRELMMDLNEILRPALSSNVFISAAYLLLDPYTGKGILARAGHCPAFLIRSDGQLEELIPPGIAIGIAENKIFAKILETQEFHMGPYDKIVLYTDGLDEMTFHNEMYGLQRLRDILVKNASKDVESLRDVILEDVLNFLSSEVQDDDLTLVVAGLPKQTDQIRLAASGK